MTLAAGDIRIMLAGDVMLGRGIDQVLPHPCDPIIYEPYIQSALGYVALAERGNGPIPRPVSFAYVWGDALHELAVLQPDLRIINLETAVTRSEHAEPKGINYRMNPANLPCLAAAGIDCCVLANNHVLDWGREGLEETIVALADAGVKTVGAGRNLEEAEAPAVLAVPGKGRVLVYAFACPSSGVPVDWAAGDTRPGVNLVDDRSKGIERLAARISEDKQAGDAVIVSIHWGANWGHGVPARDRALAHRLIERAEVDVVYGHSSHHPKAIEIHQGKPILYGCGDLLNDYEGISGHEEYRSELVLLYMLALDGRHFAKLEMLPFRIANFRLNRIRSDDAEWLWRTLDRECQAFGSRLALGADHVLSLA